jgi:hypothetical protein
MSCPIMRMNDLERWERARGSRIEAVEQRDSSRQRPAMIAALAPGCLRAEHRRHRQIKRRSRSCIALECEKKQGRGLIRVPVL